MNFSKFDEIRNICKFYSINNFKINNNGSIDVDGNVDLSSKNLTELPLVFREVTGFFNCSWNKLVTLKGSPVIVGRDYRCNNNILESLEGSPKSVRDFNCNYNKLTSLEGCPEKIGNFHCEHNNLESLHGGPKIVEGEFYCRSNNLTTLKGCPKKVFRFLAGDGNKFENLEGAPVEVVDDFNVGKNPKLKSLRGGPTKVGGYYSFDNSIVTDVSGFPTDFSKRAKRRVLFGNTPFCEILDLLIFCKIGCDSLQNCNHIKDIYLIEKIINLLNDYNVIDGDNISLMGIEKIYYELIDENYDIKKLPNEFTFKYYNVY